MQKLKRICVLILSALLILGCSFSSYADVNDLLISTDSNALMTMELDDDDYAVMPLSSVGTVINTLVPAALPVRLSFTSLSTGVVITRWTTCELNTSGRYVLRPQSVPDGYVFTKFEFHLTEDYLPIPGGYLFSVDYSSDISQQYSSFQFWYSKSYENTDRDYGQLVLTPYSTQLSGDFFVGGYYFRLTAIDALTFAVLVPSSESITAVGGNFAFSFIRADVADDAPVTSNDLSVDYSDFNGEVSSSLSDLSSSVDTMTDEISGVTEAIQNLQGAMEPHYSNVLTQLHHITEQLHAFYDQVYNNIHLPELSMLTQIKEAIENIDLQIEVDISEVKTAINNMSTAIQNKLQSVSDQITNGYDNSGMNSDQAELDNALQEYEDAEQTVIDSVNESLEDFEFDADLSEYKSIMSTISDFLQALYDSSGGLKVLINFSLLMSVAGVVIGLYRIKGGD